MALSYPIIRSEGATPTERYLRQLCDRSFLSLWSYSSVFRDQGRIDGKGDGKEVCALIVVFENNVLFFSDKHCRFPDTGNIDLDWSRWYKKAIQKSAEQLWGAERCIRDFRDRLYLDHACTQPFPIGLPDSESAQFHRIVVAHGAAERCRKEFGDGSGSLLIHPRTIGEAQLLPREKGGVPFAIGQIESAKGFVHVLDEISLDIVMQELGTVTDSVSYLTQKERLIVRGNLGAATGEEDLLACYLENHHGDGNHFFPVPSQIHSVLIDERHWPHFERSRERAARNKADEISYAWDALIESFSERMLAGTQHPIITGLLRKDGERVLRFLARESRTRRRELVNALFKFVTIVPPGQERAARVVVPNRPGDPCYVFAVLAKRPDQTSDQYRTAQANLLRGYCKVVKLKAPMATDIIGIATDMGLPEMRSEDIIYFDAREFTPEDREEARRYVSECGLFEKVEARFALPAREYPVPARITGRDRNAACPCGSGMKFKKCCGPQ